MMVTGGADPTNVVFRRACAFVADQVMIGFVALAVVSLSGMELITETSNFGSSKVQVSVNPTAVLVMSLAGLVYEIVTAVFLVGAKGWTPGKLFLGLRVVGFDGRPPGLGRAAIRGVVKWFLNQFSCFYWIAGYAIMSITKGHKGIPDMAAGTYVVDASYLGRLIMEVGGKVTAGPKSVDPELVEAYNAQQAELTGVHVPPGKRATEPFYDKTRDTYVVYSQKNQAWMQLSKTSGQWEPV